MDYYCVVEFTGSKPLQVAIIPKNWMNVNQSKCKWPPEYKKNNVMKLVQKKKDVPVESDWNEYPVRCLGTTDTYAKARSKLRRAEETSDLCTSDPEDLPFKKRTRYKPRRLIDEESCIDDSSAPKAPQFPVAKTPAHEQISQYTLPVNRDFVSRPTNTGASTVARPSCQSAHRSTNFNSGVIRDKSLVSCAGSLNSVGSSHLHELSQLHVSNNADAYKGHSSQYTPSGTVTFERATTPQVGINPEFNSDTLLPEFNWGHRGDYMSESDPLMHRNNLYEDQLSQHSSPRYHQLETVSMSSFQDDVQDRTHYGNLFQQDNRCNQRTTWNPTESGRMEHLQCSVFHQKILRTLETIKTQNQEILAFLYSNDQPRDASCSALNYVGNLPVDSEDDLRHVEDHLENQDNFFHFVQFFSSVGGKDVVKATNRVLASLITNKHAKTFSYRGSRKDKSAFCKLHLNRVVIRAVRNSVKSSTEDQIEEVIKRWLKYSNDRLKVKICASKTLLRGIENIPWGAVREST